MDDIRKKPFKFINRFNRSPGRIKKKEIFIKKNSTHDSNLNNLELPSFQYNQKEHKHIEQAYNKFSSSYIHVNRLQKNYEFQNQNLNAMWSVHPSYSPNKDFQRLEFLGDKIIASVLSKELFLQQPTYTEGQLSLKFSEMSKASTMAIIGSFLIQDIKYSGDLNNSILCDVLEAWIGAIYIDGGPVEKIILKLWQEEFKKNLFKNPKNQLQELLQKEKISFFYHYEVTQNNYKCILTFDNYKVIGFGISKKESSIKSAEKALNLLKKEILI